MPPAAATPTTRRAGLRKVCRTARRRSCRTAPVRRTARRPAADWQPRASSPAAPRFPATAARGCRGGAGTYGAYSLCRRELGHLQRRDLADVDVPFSMPGIVVGLHSNPNPRAAAKQLSNTHRNFRRNRFLLFHDIMEVLPGDAEQASDLDLRFACCREHVLPNYSAGMDGASIRISFGDIFCHLSLSYGQCPITPRASVVLFVIDPKSMTAIEFESDAPWPVHMD